MANWSGSGFPVGGTASSTRAKSDAFSMLSVKLSNYWSMIVGKISTYSDLAGDVVNVTPRKATPSVSSA